MKRITAAIALLAGFLLVAFSAQGAPKGEPGKETSAKNGKAIAVLQPMEGNQARGVVMFTREEERHQGRRGGEGAYSGTV